MQPNSGESYSSMLNMKARKQPFEYFSEQEEEEEEEEEEDDDDFIISQDSLLRPQSRPYSPPEEKRELFDLVVQKNGLKARTSPFSPTQNTKPEVPGDHQKPRGCKRKRTMFNNCDNPDESLVESRVKEMKAILGAECHIFVKSMVPSNVNSGFVLAMPKKFCDSHLPVHDAILTLEDDSGEEHRVKYIVQKEKSILSGGWRKFALANKLVVGDVLVFHLVRPLRMKVYIMGTHSLAEVDAVLSLLKLGTCAKQAVFDPVPLPRDICEGHINHNARTVDSIPALIDNEYSEEFGSDILEGVDLPVLAAKFEDFADTEIFTILVNGVSIDSLLSEQVRSSYYDLCCSQRSFLHHHLLESINGKFAAEVITETTNIANAIRACKLSTPHVDYVMWEKTLDAFELLGMNIGFLRVRLQRLLSLSFKTKQVLTRKSKEAKLEQAQAKKEVLTLKSKYWKWKERMESADAKLEALKEVAERREMFFQEEAIAPWE